MCTFGLFTPWTMPANTETTSDSLAAFRRGLSLGLDSGLNSYAVLGRDLEAEAVREAFERLLFFGWDLRPYDAFVDAMREQAHFFTAQVVTARAEIAEFVESQFSAEPAEDRDDLATYLGGPFWAHSEWLDRGEQGRSGAPPRALRRQNDISGPRLFTEVMSSALGGTTEEAVRASDRVRWSLMDLDSASRKSAEWDFLITAYRLVRAGYIKGDVGPDSNGGAGPLLFERLTPAQRETLVAAHVVLSRADSSLNGRSGRETLGNLHAEIGALRGQSDSPKEKRRLFAALLGEDKRGLSVDGLRKAFQEKAETYGLDLVQRFAADRGWQ